MDKKFFLLNVLGTFVGITIGVIIFLLLFTGCASAPAAPELTQPEKVMLIQQNQACGAIIRYVCPNKTVVSLCADPATPGNYLGVIMTNGGSQSVVKAAYSAPMGDWLSTINSCQKSLY